MNYKYDGEPDYDSGWQSLAAGDTLTLDHGLGGNANNYVVEMSFNAGASINNAYFGGNTIYTYETDPVPHLVASALGATWSDLTETSIKVRRYLGDVNLSIFATQLADISSPS